MRRETDIQRDWESLKRKEKKKTDERHTKIVRTTKTADSLFVLVAKKSFQFLTFLTHPFYDAVSEVYQ